MTKNYWRARKSYSVALILISILSLAGVAAVEQFPSEPASANLSEKLAAATLARDAMDEVKTARLEAGIPIDPAVDPSQSGLIGSLTSPVTSNNGHLPAKQTTVNPNFAAAVVSMLREAGLQQGDVVAVGFSGSFPAINICVLSAIDALRLRPIIISSASASQWGANHPRLLWIDMEKRLHDRQVFGHRSVAGSIGGIEDRGAGMSEEGLELLSEAIRRNGLEMIEPRDYLDSVNTRIALYERHAAGEPIKAYINVGGGTTSVGTNKGKKLFSPGLNRQKPPGRLPADSVMARFADRDVPVIHLVQIDHLAARHGLPQQPVEVADVGQGGVYSPREYNKWLAGGLLGVIVGSLYFAGRSKRPFPDLTRPAKRRLRDARPEEDPMPL